MSGSAWRLQGAPNFRDFGGYRIADGRRVRRGTLFRSGTLTALTTEDLSRVAGLGVRLVCDLRGGAERTHHPTRWPRESFPDVLHLEVNADVRTGDASVLDLLRRNPSSDGAEHVMLRIYREIPQGLRNHLRAVFSRLASGEGLPVLIHCTAGKDRTGVLAALILLTLGVSRTDVFADYLLTESYTDLTQREGEIAALMSHVLEVEPQAGLVNALASVREAYLDAALRAINDEHGSLPGYLASVGVDEIMVKKLQAQLLEI